MSITDAIITIVYANGLIFLFRCKTLYTRYPMMIVPTTSTSAKFMNGILAEWAPWFGFPNKSDNLQNIFIYDNKITFGLGVE